MSLHYAYAVRSDGRRIVLTDGPGAEPGSLRVRPDATGTFEIAGRWELEHMYYVTSDGERCPVRIHKEEATP